MLTVKHFFV
jgi:hypothetical protein